MEPTHESQDPDDSLIRRPVQAVACFFLSVAFVLGLPGNAVVIWTILCRMRERSPTVLLLLHLALSDLLVLATLPAWIWALADAWRFGSLLCQAVVWVVYCGMFSSILLITVLSLERFAAIFHPFSLQNHWDRATASKVIGLVWLLSLALSTPVPFTTDTDLCLSRKFSSSEQLVGLLLLETLVGFTVPFLVISTCYTCIRLRIRRLSYPGRQRTERLVAGVVVAFAICWLPYHTVNLVAISSELLEGTDRELAERLHEASIIGHCISAFLAFFSSCLNPLLYACAARSFRSSLRGTRLAKLFEQMAQNLETESSKELSTMDKREVTFNPSQSHVSVGI
ncbi:leukotriene B4 receptor 1-like [Ornithorhynchus anatinus]|uniref:leukotriene B4 receptor 1-like n=1 Tax=Ornithorhynchus anatinus TaxID=9258 RepID=UPI0004548648|nr:leukotriene B4 receptor 1-like [Ornithorhynchus anatinus]